MAVWTAMDDLTAGDLVKEADMDAIRGNIEYLHEPNTATIAHDNSADYSTTSVSYVDVDATNVTLALTTYGGPILIMATFSAANTTLAWGFQFDVGGVAVGTQTALSGDSDTNLVTLVAYYKPAAGAQTIKLQYKADGTNALVIRCSGELINMSAIEV